MSLRCESKRFKLLIFQINQNNKTYTIIKIILQNLTQLKIGATI